MDMILGAHRKLVSCTTNRYNHMSTTGTMPSCINTGHSLFAVKFITDAQSHVNWTLTYKVVMPLYLEPWKCEARPLDDGPERLWEWTFSSKSSVVLGQRFWLNDFSYYMSFFCLLSSSSLSLSPSHSPSLSLSVSPLSLSLQTYLASRPGFFSVRLLDFSTSQQYI